MRKRERINKNSETENKKGCQRGGNRERGKDC
jgi:hypothetical protein